MNYKMHYNRIIERAKFREINGYSERHHVIPRCMGGTDRKENLVRLTPEEHFLAHQLLVKIHPNNNSLIWGLKAMTISSRLVIRNNKMFGWIRRLVSNANSERIFTKETREKMSSSKLGNTYKRGKIASDETRKMLSIAASGRKHTDESKAKISAAGKRPCKEETKIKIGLSNRGRKLPPISEMTRKKLSESANGRIYRKVICNYCNKSGGVTGMKRWHFENCKAKI